MREDVRGFSNAKERVRFGEALVREAFVEWDKRGLLSRPVFILVV
jgi:hypothetical protein